MLSLPLLSLSQLLSSYLLVPVTVVRVLVAVAALQLLCLSSSQLLCLLSLYPSPSPSSLLQLLSLFSFSSPLYMSSVSSLYPLLLSTS
ncbi:hypothetical protein CVT25_008763 [Psilocybe cyanescens]|uniref:Uncharacterized protein n=1 Tax=Psilocybe cyanescens TaxID=93625 RepID=A0A409W9C1_PSICY|nr:hypothetical protein CVT25_008763 [Psilocybe cyanescens]